MSTAAWSLVSSVKRAKEYGKMRAIHAPIWVGPLPSTISYGLPVIGCQGRKIHRDGDMSQATTELCGLAVLDRISLQ